MSRLLTGACLIAMLMLVFAWVNDSRAHEFYSWACCSDQDCAPYKGAVEVRADGFWIPEFNTLVPFDKARYDMPGDDPYEYHLCELPKGTVRCLYVRPGGV